MMTSKRIDAERAYVLHAIACETKQGRTTGANFFREYLRTMDRDIAMIRRSELETYRSGR